MTRYTVIIQPASYELITEADSAAAAARRAHAARAAAGLDVPGTRAGSAITLSDRVTRVEWGDGDSRESAKVEGFCVECSGALLSRELADGSLDESDYVIDQGGDLVCGNCAEVGGSADSAAGYDYVADDLAFDASRERNE